MILRDRDYFLDDEGFIFKVIGDLHKDFVSGYVKYYPDKYGNKIFRGRRYSTSNQVIKSFQLLAHSKNKIRFSEEFGSAITGCPLSRIREVFSAKTRLQEILSKKSEFKKDAIGKKLLEIVEIFVEKGVDPKYLGITGSFLTGMNDNKSDIDFVCYGRTNCNKIAKVVKNCKLFDRYEKELFVELYKRRSTHMPTIPKDILKKQESRKIQARYKGTHFNVQPLRSDRDIKKEYESLMDLGNISITARVSDDKEGIFAPAIYNVSTVNILEGPNCPKIEKRIKKIISFVGSYSQIAKKRELIYAKGTLLKVQRKDEYFFALSIDPWNRGISNKIQVLREDDHTKNNH